MISNTISIEEVRTTPLINNKKNFGDTKTQAKTVTPSDNTVKIWLKIGAIKNIFDSAVRTL